jgi:hypothetical protein
VAKGKYKTRKHNRDATQLDDDIARLRAELAIEQERLSEMRQRADLDAELRADLAEAIAARDAACAPQIQRIGTDRDVIRTATRDLVAANQPIRRHHDRVIEWAWREMGTELFYALLTGNRAFTYQGVVSTGLSSEATEAIQRARGVRHHKALDFTTDQKRALSVAAAAATGVALPDDVTGNEGDAWDAYTEALAEDAAALIAFKNPIPWLDIAPQPEHPVSRALGANPHVRTSAINAPNTVPTVVELSTGTAAMRDATVAAGATKVADAFTPALQQGVTLAGHSQIPSPVASSPIYPAPADAASLHAWYAAAATGAWGRHRNDADGRIAVAAAAAVPYWLPPGHTIAYLDSEPLAEDDFDDLRLPFAQVLVTFAEPARLPAIAPAPLPRDDPRMAWIDHLASTKDGIDDPKDVIIAGTNNFASPFPTLWDAIATRGAYIEAVLLLGDAHGQLDDLFAWCIAIPAKTSAAVIGRWVIPASRSATSYAGIVANAAAVAAWADWHRPGHSRNIDPQGADAHADNAVGARGRPDDTVHVLNVTATTPAEATTTGVPTGRTTAPHRRRGHWRRQHYGPGRAETRRIRIAPVMVNAGRLGTDRPQIYRLPHPTKRAEPAVQSPSAS